MSHRPDFSGFLPDERVIDVAPRFTPRVGEPFVRRLNFVPGRALTADALNLERRFWDTQTELLGRAVNAGIVEGLALELLDDRPESAAIRLTPGAGITELGEDVWLARPLTAKLSEIPASEPLLESSLLPVGLVGLFLKPVRVVGALGFDQADPCPIDPEAYAYDDLVTQDGVKLCWARLDGGEAAGLPPAADRARPVRPVGGAPGDKGVLGRLSSTNLLLPPAPLLGRPDPQLVPTSVYRGLVAQRLMEQESGARRRAARPPWATHGLPVAIMQVAEGGHVLFVDRFAIARVGGAVREPAMGSSLGISPSLRRARFDQFLDHLQGLRGEGADLSPATQFFRSLPPVGVLPASVLDRTSLKCGFFPPNYVVEAAPIQLAQMESLLAARAGLAPFDLARRDYVQILVPVPDHLFHPRLLIREEISSAFEEAIKEAGIREARHRAELAELQSVETFVTAILDLGTATGKATASVTSGSTAANLRDRALEILRDLAVHTDAVPLADQEKAEIAPDLFASAAIALGQGNTTDTDYKGLRPTVEQLSQRIDQGNDQADMGFLRLQSDIFRLRKQMVGESDATRLAVSPVLANLAATTTGLESGKLFSTLVKDAPKPKTQLQLTASVRPQIMTFALRMDAPMMDAAAMVSSTIANSYRSTTNYPTVLAGSFGKSITPIEPIAPKPAAESPTKFADMGLAGIKVNLRDSIIQAKDIAWHSLIYGKSSPIRTATVAERLRPSPAQEAKNSSVATKAEIVRAMQNLGLNLAGLPLPVSASRVTLIPKTARDAELAKLGTSDRAIADIFGDADAMPVDGDVCVLSDKHILKITLLKFPTDAAEPGVAAANKAIYAKVKAITAALYDQRLTLDHPNLAGLILADRLDPDPEDPDEAAFFAAAVDALESAVSMLRLFEARVQSYAAFLDLARKAMVQAIELAEKWQGTIDDAKADIAEAAHDGVVALALMVEEQARLAAINAKRRDILEKHVDIIAFARPMTASRLANAPGLQLFRPLEELLPACLDSNAELPDEIEEIIEAMGDAPVGWYPEIAAELDSIKRPEHYHAAWQRALDRAELWLVRHAQATPRIGYAGTQERVAGKAATGVYHALSGLLAQRKAVLHTRTRRSMASLAGASWQTLRQTAPEELSVEDLEQGGKAGREVARKGATMLRHVGAVANCLLAGLRQVPAEIRLVWADRLSEHDLAVDLLDTDAIPSWHEIPLAERRELEVMHAWLFGRIDRTNNEARAMISTLVRVCLLMASHAPVSSIVEGAVVESRNVGPGESFEVDVGVGRPQIGMVATIGSGSLLNRGIIEDIVGTRVRVRVTEVPGPRIALGVNTPVRFSAPVTVHLAKVGS